MSLAATIIAPILLLASRSAALLAVFALVSDHLGDFCLSS